MGITYNNKLHEFIWHHKKKKKKNRQRKNRTNIMILKVIEVVLAHLADNQYQ